MRAKGRASDPVLQSVFMVILDHSVTDTQDGFSLNQKNLDFVLFEEAQCLFTSSCPPHFCFTNCDCVQHSSPKSVCPSNDVLIVRSTCLFVLAFVHSCIRVRKLCVYMHDCTSSAMSFLPFTNGAIGHLVGLRWRLRARAFELTSIMRLAPTQMTLRFRPFA